MAEFHVQSGLVANGPEMGHFDPFPPPRLNGRCPFSQPTSAGASGNGKVAPIPDLPALTPEREGSEWFRLSRGANICSRVVAASHANGKDP
jgi:hypothetical protein